MPFFVGDDYGNVKRLVSTVSEGALKIAAEHDLVGGSKGQQRSIQAITLDSNQQMLAVSRADGSSTVYKLEDDAKFTPIHEWSESRFKTANGHRHVGLGIVGSDIFTCNSSGHVRRSRISIDASESEKASVPTRLSSFQVSTSGSAFAYGGDEVELSVWDVSRAFDPSLKAMASTETQATKRKKTELFPAELWRAKNLPNDSLNLRRPVHITSLTYLSDPSEKQLVVGTYDGAIRRYDTRSARRPVSNWDKVVREGQGGISVIKTGLHEHELFLASSHSTVSGLDLRNGRIIYTYKGISGAVNALAPSNSHLVSSSLDRFVRIHSTSPPAKEAGTARGEGAKPAVLDKIFWKFTPTVACWDGKSNAEESLADEDASNNGDEDDEDVWDEMDAASVDDSDSEKSVDERRSKSKRMKHE